MEKQGKRRILKATSALMLLVPITNFGGNYYGPCQERIQESYEHFLKSLEIKILNAFAKKGLLWIM